MLRVVVVVVVVVVVRCFVLCVTIGKCAAKGSALSSRTRDWRCVDNSIDVFKSTFVKVYAGFFSITVPFD